jgi:hypothetical protein
LKNRHPHYQLCHAERSEASSGLSTQKLREPVAGEVIARRDLLLIKLASRPLIAFARNGVTKRFQNISIKKNLIFADDIPSGLLQ